MRHRGILLGAIAVVLVILCSSIVLYFHEIEAPVIGISTRFERVQDGMSVSEVLAILGKPTQDMPTPSGSRQMFWWIGPEDAPTCIVIVRFDEADNSESFDDVRTNSQSELRLAYKHIARRPSAFKWLWR